MPMRVASPQTRFILWAKRFDEAVATTFVSEWRTAGKRVKVVGIDGRKSVGVYGMIVTPDLTLEQAVKQVHHAQYVVLPCPATAYPRLNNDPRLAEFLQKAAARGATLLVGEALEEAVPVNDASSATQEAPCELCANFQQVMQYPCQEFLVEFVRELV